MARKNKVYSPEFKIQVIETKLKEDLCPTETAIKFDLFKNVKGHMYPHVELINRWERIYLEEGHEGFYVERRGCNSNKKRKPKQLDPNVEEDLIKKCQRLEMENEFLKKLNALVSEREQREKKSHK
ncbi:MAG: hypothetical protein K6E24_01510 [bacterium]|nr:hypothetical protein [bacterium]